MVFSLNDLVGKTIKIDDVTADVEQVINNRYLKLINFSKYKNIFYYETTYSKSVEWYNEDTTSYVCEFDPLINIPSSYSNVYIEFQYTISIYINTLPQISYIFNTETERDDYFVLNPDKLTDNRWVKCNQNFYIYNIDTETWESIPPEYILSSDSMVITNSLNTGIYTDTSTSNPSIGSYDGITDDTDYPGIVYFISSIESGLTPHNWYKISIDITDLTYKNCRDEILINNEGCLPKSYTSKRISVIPW